MLAKPTSVFNAFQSDECGRPFPSVLIFIGTKTPKVLEHSDSAVLSPSCASCVCVVSVDVNHLCEVLLAKTSASSTRHAKAYWEHLDESY